MFQKFEIMDWVATLRSLAEKNRHMLITFVDQFMVSGANFLIGIVAFHLLGLDGFGQFILILMLVTLASPYQESLLSIPMMTVVGKANRRSENYYSAIIAWGIILAAFYGLVVVSTLAVIFMLSGDVLSGHIALSSFLAVVGMNINQTMRKVFFARHQANLALLIDSLRFGSYFIGLLGLYLFVGKPQSSDVLYMIALSAFISILPFIKKMMQARRTKKLMLQVIRRHWPIGSWYILMTIVSMGQDTFIWIIMKIMIGDQAVGGLRFGQILLGVTHFIMMAMENFVPKFAAVKYKEGGIRALKHYLVQQFWLFGFVTGSLILLIAIPAEFWLHYIFSPETVQYSGVLRLYALSYAFVFTRELWNVYLRTIEKTRYSFNAYVLSTIVSLIIVYPAIKYFGIQGGAAVFTIASLISMVYTLYKVFHFYDLETTKLPLRTPSKSLGL